MISIHCVRVNLVSARFLLNCRLSFCRMAQRVSCVSFYYLEWFECIVQWDVNLKEEEKRTYQRVKWQTLKVGRTTFQNFQLSLRVLLSQLMRPS